MVVVWLFLTMPGVCLQFVIVVFPDHTYLLLRMFLINMSPSKTDMLKKELVTSYEHESQIKLFIIRKWYIVTTLKQKL